MIPYAEIQATARARLAAHHARLIPEVIPMIKEMLKEGFFGKKAKREWAQHANISSDAQSPAIVPQQQSLCRTYVRIGGRNDDCWIRPR